MDASQDEQIRANREEGLAMLPTALQGIPRLLTAPSDPGSGVAAALEIATTGNDPLQDEVIEIAVALFAYKRNTGKIMGIVDQYVGQREPTKPIKPDAAARHKLTAELLKGEKIDMRMVEYILLRAEFVVAHETAVKRPFIMRLSEQAAQRPWRCAKNSIQWVGHGAANGTGLQELLTGHRIKNETPYRALPDLHGLLMLLQRTDDRGRPYLLQLV